jgi:DnaJ domain
MPVARQARRAAPPGALASQEVIMYPALPIQQPAGEAAAASGSVGRDAGSAVEPGLLAPGITWYDVLGVLPGAEARKINRAYDAKTALLRPDLIWGAPPDVLTAALRAQQLLDTAREVLGDPDSRYRYDQATGLRCPGGGLGQPGTGTGPAVLAPGDRPSPPGWPGPRHRRTRAAVPDVRGLFYQACLEVATRRGLHLRIIRLTERPMPVDGLVVDQDPRPPAKPSRGGTLTVQLWHPPARPR